MIKNRRIKFCVVTCISSTIKAFFIPQLRYLSENGFDVTVVCSPDPDLQQCLGNEIRFIPVSIARGIAPNTIAKSVKELKEVFIKEQFDIVQYSTPNAGFCAAMAAKQAKVKLTNYHLMGFRFLGAQAPLRTVLKALEKYVCSNSDYIECVSESNLKFGVEQGLFTEDKATVVWHGSTGGVDLSRFDVTKKNGWRTELRKKIGLDANEFVYGFVGRITRDKGINELLSAFFNLNNDSKLLFIGSNEGIDTLDADLYQKALKNKNIIFIDSVSDIERYYSVLDVLVFPSYREGFGNVVIEAGAMGVPAIITNIPGPVDAVEADKTAKIIKVKDADELLIAMKQLYDDPALLQILSENAHEFVSSHFDSEKLNEKILERKKYLADKC